MYKRQPFNITTLSLRAGILALKDEKFVQDSVEENFSQMKRYEEFSRENGLEYIESYTNFITIKLPDSSKSTEISQNLLKKGIIVRDLGAYGMNAIRVTIGTPEQNSKFFQIYKLL